MLEVFDGAILLGTGMLELIDWLKKALTLLSKKCPDSKVCRGKLPAASFAIKRWFGEIVGYFERKTTKVVVEGINNKLKLIKRNGFG